MSLLSVNEANDLDACVSNGVEVVVVLVGLDQLKCFLGEPSLGLRLYRQSQSDCHLLVQLSVPGDQDFAGNAERRERVGADVEEVGDIDLRFVRDTRLREHDLSVKTSDVHISQSEANDETLGAMRHLDSLFDSLHFSESVVEADGLEILQIHDCPFDVA